MQMTIYKIIFPGLSTMLSFTPLCGHTVTPFNATSDLISTSSPKIHIFSNLDHRPSLECHPTMDPDTKLPSIITEPSKITLFLIRTLFPIWQFGPITTFGPINDDFATLAVSSITTAPCMLLLCFWIRVSFAAAIASKYIRLKSTANSVFPELDENVLETDWNWKDMVSSFGNW